MFGKYIKWFILASIILMGSSAAIYYYKSHINYTEGSVYDYDPKIDREFILQLFKDNWHWLVSEYSTDFDPVFMLDNSEAFARKRGVTDMKIKVYRVQNKPVGFTVYYIRPILRGDILFLAIDEKYRKKGYARKLIQNDIDDLKKKGCFVIKITTRVTNTPARTLYESYGFKELWIDRGFIKYELNI